MSDEPEPNELDPLLNIRYVFTLVMPLVALPADPLGQRAWLDETIQKIQDAIQPERIGVVAVTKEP